MKAHHPIISIDQWYSPNEQIVTGLDNQIKPSLWTELEEDEQEGSFFSQTHWQIRSNNQWYSWYSSSSQEILTSITFIYVILLVCRQTECALTFISWGSISFSGFSAFLSHQWKIYSYSNRQMTNLAWEGIRSALSRLNWYLCQHYF